MTNVHARKALLPSGWADGVRLGISAGRIDSIDSGVAADLVALGRIGALR